MGDIIDVICVGNSLIDIFLLIQNENKHIAFNQDSNSMAIKLGDKILVDDYKLSLGGSASNVAVGLARLGLKTSIVSSLGKDEFAERILDIFNKEHVSTERILNNKKGQTSFSMILNYNNDRTIFTEHVETKHDFNFENVATAWIYLADVGKDWETAYEKVLGTVEKTGANLAFNPGSFEIEARDSLFNKLLSISNVLILNKEEAIKLVGNSNMGMIDLLREVKKTGAKIVVITDGAQGSYLINSAEDAYYLRCFPATTIDPTGAGDAYSSGFIFGHIGGKSLEESMFLGAANAAYVAEAWGGQDGLLKFSDIVEKTKKFEQFSAENYIG